MGRLMYMYLGLVIGTILHSFHMILIRITFNHSSCHLGYTAMGLEGADEGDFPVLYLTLVSWCSFAYSMHVSFIFFKLILSCDF